MQLDTEMVGHNIVGELEMTEDLDVELKRFNSISKLLPSVIVQPSSIVAIQRVFKMTENDLRKIISEAVE